MPSEFPYTIRPLATHDEYRAIEGVQSRAWNTNDLRDIVPVHVLLTAQKEGGLVAGAFDTHGHLVAFVFGFIGRTPDGRYKHCSHMMGVVPEARGSDVGYRLKLFQRQYVIKQDFDLVTWTYDPLEGRNAMLNITKLGGVAHKYYFNLYGDWADGLNAGLATDRFEVEWWVKTERAALRAEGNIERPALADLRARGVPIMVSAAFDHAGYPHPMAEEFYSQNMPDDVLMEMPADFQRVKSFSMDLARAWRAATAKLFNSLFSMGYTACEYYSEAGEADAPRRNYYLLSRSVPGCTPCVVQSTSSYKGPDLSGPVTNQPGWQPLSGPYSLPASSSCRRENTEGVILKHPFSNFADRP